MKGWSDGCNHPVRTRCLRVQGPCGPRATRRQPAAPGASVRSLPRSCAPAQGAARASRPGNFNQAREQDPPGPAPRHPPPDLRSPAKPGVAAPSRHHWDGGERTGHARSRAGPERPGGGASWQGERHLPQSSAGPSATRFPPSVRVGSGGFFFFFQSPVGKLGIQNPRKTFSVLSQPLCDLG